MQRDPDELSIPLDRDSVFFDTDTGELPLPQIPPEPPRLASSPARAIWEDQTEIATPVVGGGFADPQLLDTVVSPETGGAGSSLQRQRTRRRLATGCSSLCIGLILLALSATALIYLRPEVEQPGSGQAVGVEVHTTPALSPLAQRATSTATPGSGKQRDPNATPTPRPGPKPAPTTGTGKPKQLTPSPVIQPTPVPTIGTTPAPTIPASTPTAQPQPTATQPAPPTATVVPTATTTASSGTLSFTDQSTQWSNPADMQGCPSGCTFQTQSVAGSAHESTTQGTTGRVPQTQLSGSLNIDINCSIFPQPCVGSLFIGSVCGGGFCCPINDTFSGGDAQGSDPCTINTASPSFLAPGTISGQRSITVPRGGTLTVSWASTAFSGNGGQPYVSQADCNNGLNVVAGLANTWISTTWGNASQGNVIARGYSSSESNWSCFPGVGALASSFTASVDVSISNGLVYNPYGPINAALAALKSAAPGGTWNWVYTSPACYPSTVAVSGTSVTADCQDSALAVWTWSTSDEAALAQAVAGQTLGQAQTTCTGWAHVAGNCVATSDAGNRMPPPSNWQAITVTPQNPLNPFAGATAAIVLPDSSSSVLTELLPLLSMELLLIGCTGIFQRRRRTRKAV